MPTKNENPSAKDDENSDENSDNDDEEEDEEDASVDNDENGEGRSVSVLVCSDGMSRGVDLPGVTCVVNYDLPAGPTTPAG